MPILGIDHVQLAMPVGGEDAARSFYRDVLSLSEQPKPAVLAQRGGCWFANEAVQIHLGVERDFRPAKKAHPAFRVDALDSIVAECRARGLEVVAADPLDGYRRVHVHDPFGNRIELLQAT